MEGDFPGVVDLNVSGTHYRVLLSTLTKDEDSKLAAMFTGQLPVYKDKDGRYFIEADGTTFKAILHYLRYDELPFQEASNYSQTGFGFGAFGGQRTSLFSDHHSGYSARSIEMMYKDALNLGLTKLARQLEQFRPNFVNIKMDEYRDSITGYDECLTAILNIIPAEALFHRVELSLRIKQDLQTIEDRKCCEHECKMIPWNSFGYQVYASIDAVVKVRFDVNPTVLSALAIDLQKRGFMVQGRMTVCDFNCMKEVKRSKYIVFADQAKKCCSEELFLLTFQWDTDANVVTNSNIYRTGQNQTTGGLFGSKQNTGFAFGATAQKQTTPSLFGGGQQGNVGQCAGFGSSQQQGSFGQATGFGFGSSQQGSGQAQTTGFGSAQPQGSGLFGGTQQESFGQNQTSVFGSPSNQGNIFGGQQQQHQQQSVFGKQPQAFCFAQSSTQQQGSGLFGQQGTQQQGTGLFGSASLGQQSATLGPPANKSIFGGSSSTSTGNQNLLFKSGGTGQQKTTCFGPVGFSFGSPSKQPSAFAGKGAGFGNSGQSIFGTPQNQSQHVFGGTPTFENKFSGLSLQQTTGQTGSSFTTSADVKSNNLFGKTVAADDNTTQQLEPDKEQLDKLQ